MATERGIDPIGHVLGQGDVSNGGKVGATAGAPPAAGPARAAFNGDSVNISPEALEDHHSSQPVPSFGHHGDQPGLFSGGVLTTAGGFSGVQPGMQATTMHTSRG